LFTHSKTDRKINFGQFQKALELVAEKKYPGDGEGLKKLKDKIAAGKGPGTSGVTVREIPISNCFSLYVTELNIERKLFKG
jgi:hypothetical protein